AYGARLLLSTRSRAAITRARVSCTRSSTVCPLRTRAAMTRRINGIRSTIGSSSAENAPEEPSGISKGSATRIPSFGRSVTQRRTLESYPAGYLEARPATGLPATALRPIQPARRRESRSGHAARGGHSSVVAANPHAARLLGGHATHRGKDPADTARASDAERPPTSFDRTHHAGESGHDPHQGHRI